MVIYDCRVIIRMGNILEVSCDCRVIIRLDAGTFGQKHEKDLGSFGDMGK